MSRIKAVIDTNIMISAAFPKGKLTVKLRDMIADEVFILVTSKKILAELYRVLHYEHIQKLFKPSKQDIDGFIGLILEKALITKEKYSIEKIENDPDDNMFLTCALEGNADFIVSRDPHLRNLKQFQRINIVDLKSFLEKTPV